MKNIQTLEDAKKICKSYNTVDGIKDEKILLNLEKQWNANPKRFVRFPYGTYDLKDKYLLIWK